MDIYLENERRLAAAFLLHNITYVCVVFDGSGDSGQIDDILIVANGQTLTEYPLVTVWVQGELQFDAEQKCWVRAPKEERAIPLNEALEDLVYAQLDQSGVNWYDNDGGFGTWEWTPEDGVDFSINLRVIDHYCAHAENRPLGQLNEDEEKEEKV